MKNYYEMLGVSYTATNQEIKKAYLAMLKQYHPDVFKGNKKIAEEFSARLNVAYDTLSNAEKRMQYDKSIFPTQLTSTYNYDNEGNRVALTPNLQKSRKKQASFNFFGNSVVSEKVHKVLKRTKEEKLKIKKEMKETKRLEKFAKQTQKQNLKTKRKRERQLKKLSKIEEKQLRKKSLSQEKLYQKSKRNLDITIIIISCVLIVFFVFMVYLNINYS